ncbi:unnamed protein product [Staurois parvus]|uniref:Cystatin domain-containing protein n=1 Tax=Staurois parvus TaxID=386267 RepID=A0ABN9CKF1_9NEOB|nr:unnamed protein product [Staurois parvus]
MSKTAESAIGGVSEPRTPTAEDQAILDEVKEPYEKQSGTNPKEFKAVLVGTQVVAGTNYSFKEDPGEDTFIHVRVFVPLPGTGEKSTLVPFQLDKKKDDELEYF